MAMKETHEYAAENLFAATQMMPVVADKFTVSGGQGALPRGALMQENGTVCAGEGEEVYCVLAEAVDASNGEVTCAVYLTGEFNASALYVANDLDPMTFKKAARKVGIFLKPSV